MLFDQTDNTHEILRELGLSDEAIDIFLYIARNGPSTALEINRELTISRTKVYRILDILCRKKLILQVMGERGLKFEVQPELNLDLLVVERESELVAIKKALPIIKDEIWRLRQTHKQESKVIHYRGAEGLAQITWNSTKAKDGLRIYQLSQSIVSFLDQATHEDIRKDYVKNKVYIKQLTNATIIEDYTDVEELVKNFWECKYVNPRKFQIKNEIMIYDDVIAMFTYKDNEILCVEIHNPQLAQMQMQLFDYVWNDSKKFMVISPKGGAKIKH